MRPVAILLHFLGFCASLGLMFLGICGLVDASRAEPELHWLNSAPNFDFFIADFNILFGSAEHAAFLILVGLISLLSECKINHINNNFQFLGHLMGHGIFYLVFGIFGLGVAGNMGILIGAIVAGVGAMYILLCLLCGSEAKSGYHRI